MTKEQKNKILAMVAEMPQNTATEKARVSNILRHLANAENDSGAYGRICEIFAKSEKSHAVNFAKQGRADCFVWVDGKRYNAEYKTNGGRIGSLYGKKAPKFVVYQMDICNAGTSHLRREIPPVVMKTEKFLAILEECNATKSTNGTNPETAIQVTSKKLFIALSEYTLTYDPNHRYTETDF